jgi:calmodulin-binding transcription activator
MQEKMPEESTGMDEGFLMSEFKELWDDDMPTSGYF